MKPIITFGEEQVAKRLSETLRRDPTHYEVQRVAEELRNNTDFQCTINGLLGAAVDRTFCAQAGDQRATPRDYPGLEMGQEEEELV